NEIKVLIAERPSAKNQLLIATGNNSGKSPNSAKAAPPPKADSMYNTGLSLVDLSASFRDTIGMPRNQVGVYVEAVAPGSAAARKGIKDGMVILKADDKPVASVRAFRKIVQSLKKSNQRSLVLLVRTINGSETYTSISLN
ncbi:MAG: PDZ domain-containing protein, partial [Robiginitomaculum sp.]|nr:PDZ domain-containing protein [Robiginitomaculum sp.]